jgi:twitching motility protein PilT
VSTKLSVVTQAGSATHGSAEAQESKRLNMVYLLKALIKYNASDLHIKVGRSPLYRINGKLVPAKMPELSADEAKSIIYRMMTERQIRDLEERRQVDLSFQVDELGRFRCNVYFQRGTVSAAIRLIPIVAPNFDKLGLPGVLKDLCMRPRGLLLITGATGSGKSTTLSAVIQYLNELKNVHILVIEDPIEFVYRDLKASITQREVGSDTPSFQAGLVSGLRQDPDVVVIGEVRDRETIGAALTAAETGHLVLATLHTNDAKSTIDRILDVFPAEAQSQVRVQLASSLVGVISQRLVVRSDGSGRVLATEVMVKSPTIEACLLKNERERIPDAIANSGHYYKMNTLNMSLEKLVREGRVTLEEALKHSPNPDDLSLRFSGISRGDTNDQGETHSIQGLSMSDLEIHTKR